ncbi:cytochrome P450 [Corynespora cassiicola Philippines]|uniref:Cytochrome P450 n=1 Tax=Corynespora cassiicola Philippines TaxID=1448308 RepID=A0A2T2PDB2_CORCC|nr:cytochrome P450 [Corynespora cassiicola Philippines]
MAMVMNFVAGHDTTSFTLSSRIYYICTNSGAKQQISDETSEAKIDLHASCTEIASKIPYLVACIKEVMRLSPAIGFCLPRVVPDTGTTLCSTHLPAGTTIAVSLWAVHRDADIFESPEDNKEKKKQISRIDACWLGFGAGSRSCLSQLLARFLMVKFLIRLFTELDFDLTAWFLTHMEGVEGRFRELGSRQG